MALTAYETVDSFISLVISSISFIYSYSINISLDYVRNWLFSFFIGKVLKDVLMLLLSNFLYVSYFWFGVFKVLFGEINESAQRSFF